MDWSKDFIPPMRLEARFGDRVVPAFCERPKNISAMVEQGPIPAAVRKARFHVVTIAARRDPGGK